MPGVTITKSVARWLRGGVPFPAATPRRRRARPPGPARERVDLVDDRARHADRAERVLVEAGQHRDADDERRRAPRPSRRLACAASRAAFIMAAPPQACTLTIHTPSLRGLGRRAGHRVRDVVELQVEEHAVAALGEPPHDAGPAAVNSWLPTLTPPTAPRSVSASASAFAGLSTSSATRMRIHWPCSRAAPQPRRTPACRRDRPPARSRGASCSPSMPASSFGQMNGSTKLAVPTCTAVAPAIMNSSTSRALRDAAHADDRDAHLPARTRTPCARRSAGWPGRSGRP